jgi:1-acyl-sn-glycerol-3-phosphate acyltransferase
VGDAPGPAGPAWSRWLGRFAFRVVWNTQPIGLENVPADGPVILAANHVHFVDGPMLIGMAPRPLHILVKKEMFSGPAGLLMRAAGQIKTDRTNGREALLQALAVLRRGGAIGIFPEGQRGTGDLRPVRSGAAWLAVNAGALVVPVAIVGTRRSGQSKEALPPPRRRFVIEFGEPLDLVQEGVPRRQAVADGTERIRAALAALVADAAERTGLVFGDAEGTAQ